MPITTLPTQSEPSLGQSKSDTGLPYVAATHIKASIWNELILRVLELFTDVGLTAGTTVGSLRRGYLPTLLQLLGTISPAQITVDPNDYAPTGHADATFWRLDLNANRTVTGIVGGAAGRVLIIRNISAFNLILKAEAGGSTAANRFTTDPRGGDTLVPPGSICAIFYSATDSRWVPFVVPVGAASTTVDGQMSAADKTKLNGIEALADVTDAANVAAAGAVMNTRQVIAGAGITGGGALSGDVTLNAVAHADASIVVAADSIQVGVLATDAQHGVRGGGTQHAIVTDAANGFLDKDQFDGALGKGKTWHQVWRETYKGTVNEKIQGIASGTGAAAQVAVASGYEGIGRLVSGTGAAAYAYRAASLNWWYNNGGNKLTIEWVGLVLGPLADATDDYRVHVCGLGALPVGGSTTGFTLTYDRLSPTPANWYLTKWTAGVPNYSIDSGVAVDLARHRYKVIYDPIAATAQYFIDGVSVGTLTAIASVSGVTPLIAMIQRQAGASRELYEEFSECWLQYSTARPG